MEITVKCQKTYRDSNELPNMSLKEYSVTENAVVDLEKPASVTITSFEEW